MNSIAISVPEELRGCVESSLTRLGYLYPEVELIYDSAASEVSARSGDGKALPDDLRKEILYQLYRERVYQETLPIRRRLYGEL